MIVNTYLEILILIQLVAILFFTLKGKSLKLDKGFVIPTFLFFTFDILHIAFFLCSTYKVFPIEFSVILWKSTLVSWFLINISWSSFYLKELHKNNNWYIVPISIYVFLFGVFFSLLVNESNITPIETSIGYIFLFKNDITFELFLILNFLLIFISLSSHVFGLKNYFDKEIIKYFTIILLAFTFDIIVLSFFIFSFNLVLNNIHVISRILIQIFLLYTFFKKENIFFVFTNKIYNFILFHRSGILLYSYDFEKNQEIKESVLKGSILIGINHILANFFNVKNQISNIKLGDQAVILNYNKDLGFATLLTAKYENPILLNLINKFNDEFSKKYKNILTQLRGLIDITQFKETGDLIEKYFKIYITNSSNYGNVN